MRIGVTPIVAKQCCDAVYHHFVGPLNFKKEQVQGTYESFQTALLRLSMLRWKIEADMFIEMHVKYLSVASQLNQ